MLLWALSVLCQAFIFGAIAFFSALVAPLVFSALPAETAAGFIRRIFPRYYLSLIIIGVVGGLAALPFDGWVGLALLLIAAGAVYARQILMPAANRARDDERRGAPGAAARFRRLNQLSVVINLLQLVVIVAALLAF